MPAPEEQPAALYEFLLRRNQRLFGMRFSIGPEDAIYLTGQLPLAGRRRGRARPGDRVGLHLRRAVVPPCDAHRVRVALSRLSRFK